MFFRRTRNVAPTLSLKRKLRLESLDERAVPSTSPGDPPDTPPPQTGDPAAQAAVSILTYAVGSDGAVELGRVSVPVQNGSPPSFSVAYDTSSGALISINSNFAGQTGVVQPPTDAQPHTLYVYDPASGGWTASALPVTDTLLSPASGNTLTPIPSSDGQGVAWAVTPQALAVAHTVPVGGQAAPDFPIPPPPPPPAPGAEPRWFRPGSVIRLGNGEVIELPGGGWVFVNPNDGGFWVYPANLPGTRNGVPIPLQGHTDVEPQPPSSGGGVDVPPGTPPIDLPRPPTPPVLPALPMWWQPVPVQPVPWRPTPTPFPSPLRFHFWWEQEAVPGATPWSDPFGPNWSPLLPLVPLPSPLFPSTQ